MSFSSKLGDNVVANKARRECQEDLECGEKSSCNYIRKASQYHAEPSRRQVMCLSLPSARYMETGTHGRRRPTFKPAYRDGGVDITTHRGVERILAQPKPVRVRMKGFGSPLGRPASCQYPLQRHTRSCRGEVSLSQSEHVFFFFSSVIRKAPRKRIPQPVQPRANQR